MHFPTHHILMATAILTSTLLTTTLAQDEGESDPTVNVCITPRACFTTAASPDIDYCVTTAWHVTYPAKIRAQIDDAARNPDYTVLDDPFNCGWSYGYSVSRASVTRGSFYYRTASNGSFDYPPHMLSDTRGAFDALHDTYPGVEIGLILLFTVGTPVIIVVFIIVGAGASGFAQRIARAKANRRQRRIQKAASKAEEKARKAEEKRQREESGEAMAWRGTEKLPETQTETSSGGSMV